MIAYPVQSPTIISGTYDPDIVNAINASKQYSFDIDGLYPSPCSPPFLLLSNNRVYQLWQYLWVQTYTGNISTLDPLEIRHVIVPSGLCEDVPYHDHPSPTSADIDSLWLDGEPTDNQYHPNLSDVNMPEVWRDSYIAHPTFGKSDTLKELSVLDFTTGCNPNYIAEQTNYWTLSRFMDYFGYYPPYGIVPKWIRHRVYVWTVQKRIITVCAAILSLPVSGIKVTGIANSAALTFLLFASLCSGIGNVTSNQATETSRRPKRVIF